MNDKPDLDHWLLARFPRRVVAMLYATVFVAGLCVVVGLLIGWGYLIAHYDWAIWLTGIVVLGIMIWVVSNAVMTNLPEREKKPEDE